MIVNFRRVLLAGVIALLSCTGIANAEIALPRLLGDGAVLQRGEPIPIWGTALPDSSIIVRFAGEERRAQSDKHGQWRTIFTERTAGGPFQLSVSSDNDSVTVKNILIGDVWIASGQSNMEWPLRNTNGADAEIRSASNEHIRHFKIPRSWAVSPASEVAGGQWSPATTDYLPEFSGVAWYFAKKINAATDIPIGIINATWGGSNIESWMSAEALGIPLADVNDQFERLIAESEARSESVKKTLQRWPNALVKQVTNANADWRAENINEQDWLTITAPDLWEQQGLPGVDGVIWYRKSFTLNEAEAARDLTLSLARIDDNDTTWVNGTEVGGTNAYDVLRSYQVPAKLLKPGKNQIAIRVEDTGGGGGIYSDEDLLYLQSADGTQKSLVGEWKIKADKVTVSVLENVNHTDTALYNKMLHPLFNIPVKGVIWYQGESNANTVEQAEKYRQQFQALITDWRARWNNSDVPFYWVQLASFNSNRNTDNASPWAILRDSQSAALTLNNTGQAITIDVGDPKDIHPRDKKTVGDRLARIALNKTYGHDKVNFRGPTFESFTIKGNQLIVKFAVKGRLATADKSNAVKGFEVAGADGNFKPIDGKMKKNKMIFVLSDWEVPLSLRYAWDDNPGEANLVDGDGLPAAPFRLELTAKPLTKHPNIDPTSE